MVTLYIVGSLIDLFIHLLLEVIKAISGKGDLLKYSFFFDAMDGKGIVEDNSHVQVLETEFRMVMGSVEHVENNIERPIIDGIQY